MNHNNDIENNLKQKVEEIEEFKITSTNHKEELLEELVELILLAQEEYDYTIPEIEDITDLAKATIYKYIKRVRGVRFPDKAYNKPK